MKGGWAVQWILVVSISTGQWAVMFDDWVMSVADLLDNSVEPVNFVGCVVDDTFCAIGLNQWVWSFHLITVTWFPGLFIVTSVQILNGITEFVVSWCLPIKLKWSRIIIECEWLNDGLLLSINRSIFIILRSFHIFTHLGWFQYYFISKASIHFFSIEYFQKIRLKIWIFLLRQRIEKIFHLRDSLDDRHSDHIHRRSFPIHVTSDQCARNC